MPNKEKAPSKALLASEPEYMAINDFQILLMVAVNLRIACNSRVYPGGESTVETPLAAGYLKTIDGASLPETTEELTIMIDAALELQQELLKSVKTSVERKQANGTQSETMALVPVPNSASVVNDEGTWPVQRSDEEWDRRFSESPFAELVNELDFGKSIV